MPQLENKVAIITGGGSGIGEATAALLAEHGAAVAVADIRRDQAERVADAIRDEGGNAVAIEADVREESAIVAMVRTTIEAFGRLDVLHNNATSTQSAEYAADGSPPMWPLSTARQASGPTSSSPARSTTPAYADNVPPRLDQLLRASVALPYLGRPPDVAHLVLFLASDESRFITGTELAIDGGLSSVQPHFAHTGTADS